MKNFEIGGIQISAISACVPKKKQYTSAYEGFSSAEASSFEKHVGVVSKRNSNGKLTAADLCLAATEVLLKDITWNRSDIGLLLFVSQSPDYALPNTALLLQHKLGLNSSCICFDLRLGCTGWVTGLSVAASMMKSFSIKKALLLAGETNIIADIRDKATYPLMGDAGTATALELNNNASPMFLNFSSDGEQHQAIVASKSGARYIAETGNPDILLSMKTSMDGTSIFKYISTAVVASINSLQQFSNKTVIDKFVFHQANKLLVESIRKKLDVDITQCPYSIEEFGNTSSASIPLTIVCRIGGTRLPKQLMCCSFGVGLSTANVLLNIKGLHCSTLVELEE